MLRFVLTVSLLLTLSLLLNGSRALAQDVSLSRGIVVITGTNYSDAITVSRSAGKYRSAYDDRVIVSSGIRFRKTIFEAPVYKKYWSRYYQQIHGIHFSGRAGNDRFTNLTDFPAIAFGGPDNDRQFGG